MPSDRPKSRSARSFCVVADNGNTTPGTFTPLRSDSMPPLTTVVSAKSPPDFCTFGQSRPSSRSSARGLSAAKISGCGSGARLRPPACRDRCQGGTVHLPRSPDRRQRVPMRSNGPCRSAAPRSGGRCRLDRADPVEPLLVWSACVPWLKFKRNTSAPREPVLLRWLRGRHSQGRAWQQSWRCRGVAS